jgi:hypothetical protein
MAKLKLSICIGGVEKNVQICRHSKFHFSSQQAVPFYFTQPLMCGRLSSPSSTLSELTNDIVHLNVTINHQKCLIASLNVDLNLISSIPAGSAAYIDRDPAAAAALASTCSWASQLFTYYQHLGHHHLHYLTHTPAFPSASSLNNCDTISTANLSPRGA